MFISERTIYSHDAIETIRHELAHVLSGDPDHGHNFHNDLDMLGGVRSPTDDVFKRVRRRLGIPTNIAGNIGQISGIQEILIKPSI